MTKSTRLLVAAMVAETLLLAFGAPAGTVQVEKGKDLFGRRCSGCHSLDANKEGPRLRDVYGRRAAALSGFGYSEALRGLRLRWDDSSLDRWLADPEAMAPNNDMAFRLNAPEERTALIAYLKSLGG